MTLWVVGIQQGLLPLVFRGLGAFFMGHLSLQNLLPQEIMVKTQLGVFRITIFPHLKPGVGRDAVVLQEQQVNLSGA